MKMSKDRAESQQNLSLPDEYSLAQSDETRMSILENRLSDNHISGKYADSLASDTTIGQHTLLRHELNQKELDVYMLNTRLTWHEKILNERDAMITRKTDEIEELKKKIQHQSGLVHSLETQLHQEKSKIQSLTTQKAHLKTLHEELKLRGKEDREQNRKLQRRIGELEDSTRSQLLNRSITHNEDTIKEIERNISAEMKSLLSQFSKSFEMKQSSVLQEIRTQNQTLGEVEKMQKENSKLNLQIQQQKQTIQKMTWKLETYTEKYQKMKDENQRLQTLYDSTMGQILSNQENLVSTMKKQSSGIENKRSSEEKPINQPIVLALGKMEQLLETLQATSLTKNDFQSVLRDIQSVQSTVSVTPKLLKDIVDSVRETRSDLTSKLTQSQSESAAAMRLQDQIRHLEQMLIQKVDQHTGEIMAKIEIQPLEGSDRRVSTEYLNVKITSEMQRLNQTVEKSLKHSVDKLYDTLKQSFDLLAKNIREMTCGESSLANRSGGANELEDLLHRISNAVDGISMKLSKQEVSQKPEGLTSSSLSELMEAINSKEIITNQDILLTQFNELREEVSLYSKNSDDGFSFFHQQLASKNDINEFLSHFMTSDVASNLQNSTIQQLQEYMNLVHQDLKAALTTSVEGTNLDPLRRGSIEFQENLGASASDPILQCLEELKLRIDGVPRETEQMMKSVIESNTEIRSLAPKSIIEYFDAKLGDLRALIESRRISREPFSPRNDNDLQESQFSMKEEANLNNTIDSDAQDSLEIVESKRESIANVIREFRVVMDEMTSFITTGRQSLPEMHRLTKSVLDGISTIYSQLNTNKSLNTFNEVQNLHTKLESHLVPLFKFFIQSNSPGTFEHSLLQWSNDIIQSYQNQIPQPIVADIQIDAITKSVEKVVKDVRAEDMRVPEIMHQDIDSFHKDVATLQKEIIDVQNLNIPSLAQRFIDAVHDTREQLSWQKWAIAISLAFAFILPFLFVRTTNQARYGTI